MTNKNMRERMHVHHDTLSVALVFMSSSCLAQSQSSSNNDSCKKKSATGLFHSDLSTS